ncbi:MAG: hypothetical protein QM676_07095 [Novosphingobium sp.]
MFGCLFAFLLGAGMGSIIFVGSAMGDCLPDEPCPNRTAQFFKGIALTLPIVALGALAFWILSSGLHRIVQGRLSLIALRIVFLFATIGAVWWSFDPAFELFFWIQGND